MVQDSLERNETKGQMMHRHKRELRTLKDQAKRAGKNAKEEFRMKELEMCSRHRHETEDFDKCLRSAGDSAANAIQHDQEAAALERICKLRQRSKQKRERKQIRELEDQKRISEELGAAGETDRDREQDALDQVLAKHGLKVFDIPADGNCMYRALEHQCRVLGLVLGDSQMLPHLLLREMAANYIESRQDEFSPFIINSDICSNEQSQMTAYIAGVRGNEWGSQVELQALAEALGVQIQVFTGSYPVVDIGKTNAHEGNGTLQLCYLEHAYTCGQHYNSVVMKP